MWVAKVIILLMVTHLFCVMEKSRRNKICTLLPLFMWYDKTPRTLTEEPSLYIIKYNPCIQKTKHVQDLC